MKEGDALRDWRTLSLVVFSLVILIFIANIHLEVRGEVEEVGIFTRFLHSAIISFTFTNAILCMITFALYHKHARLIEQALGTFLATVLGIFVFGLLVDSNYTVEAVSTDAWSQFTMVGVRIFVSLLSIILAFGASFGLLLTLVTGRETPLDTLLELESTSFVDEEE